MWPWIIPKVKVVFFFSFEIVQHNVQLSILFLLAFLEVKLIEKFQMINGKSESNTIFLSMEFD